MIPFSFANCTSFKNYIVDNVFDQNQILKSFVKQKFQKVKVL